MQTGTVKFTVHKNNRQFFFMSMFSLNLTCVLVISKQSLDMMVVLDLSNSLVLYTGLNKVNTLGLIMIAGTISNHVSRLVPPSFHHDDLAS